MEINGRTALTGIIGYPLIYTISPQLHNAAAEALEINLCYVPMVVKAESLAPAIAGLKALGFLGVNVTMPHKEAVLDFLDELDGEAEAIGAVNTISFKDGLSIGWNTDARGFLSSLREAGFDPAGKKAVIIGAGGAARAVLVALVNAGSEVAVVNRTMKRAQALAEEMKGLFTKTSLRILESGDELADTFGDAQLIVNATPVGMPDSINETPIPTGLLHRGHVVVDLIYEPAKTRLMREAEDMGAVAIGGLSMLVHQAASSFEIWTGVKPPIASMVEAGMRALERGR